MNFLWLEMRKKMDSFDIQLLSVENEALVTYNFTSFHLLYDPLVSRLLMYCKAVK